MYLSKCGITDSHRLFLTFQLVIQVLQNDPDHLDQRQDQRAKSQRACVVPAKRGGVDLNPVHHMEQMLMKKILNVLINLLK